MNKLLISTILTTALCSHAVYAGTDISPDDLLNMSLEQLANVEVTSVSKKAEKASEAAAAIFVITQDDIRRSGATSIPEALRMAPGLNVAQSGSHAWAISSRGFNDQFANKLLVLMDGRSVYTPIFSGVFWDVQDTALADIERIEVIRGPGATLWGANAVNGVINIITKQAKDTQGGYASVSAGNYDRTADTVRYGTKLGDSGHVRAYAKYNERDEARSLTGAGAHDEWNKAQAGFRADMTANETHNVTVQGDVYRGGEDYSVNLPLSASAANTDEVVLGGNILARWTNKLSATSETTLQMYYDNAQRTNISRSNNSLLYSSNVDTFDVDMQHTWTPVSGHDVVWGGSYRLVQSEILGEPYTSFTPQSRSDNLFSAFVQDKITLAPDRLFLTLGSKFERNDYTKFEYQPSARLQWLADSNQTVWASVSRAVRTPNIANDGAQVLVTPISGGPTVFLAQTNNSSLNSEDLIAYELGYRVQPASNVSVDATVYYNDYDNLLLGALGPVTGPFVSPVLGAYFVQTTIPVNTGSAHAWGAELSTKWNPTEKVELAASYTLQKLKFEQVDTYSYSFTGKSPEHQLNVRSTVFLPHNLEWNTSAYYVSSLSARDLATGLNTNAYTRLDTRLAWQATDAIEVSLVGQNLLDPAHKEFNGFLYQSVSAIPRSYYANVAVKF